MHATRLDAILLNTTYSDTIHLDAMLRTLAWPAYGASAARYATFHDRSRLERTEEFVLAAERFGFLADAATTELGLESGCHEVDPLNTLFGNRNRFGVLGSMTVWEVGTSYASVAVPRWFEHTRFRNPARVAAILGNSVLAVNRIRASTQNFRLAQE